MSAAIGWLRAVVCFNGARPKPEKFSTSQRMRLKKFRNVGTHAVRCIQLTNHDIILLAPSAPTVVTVPSGMLLSLRSRLLPLS